MSDFLVPRRQSKKAILLYMFKGFKTLAFALLPIIFTGIGEHKVELLILGITAGVLLISLIISYLNWRYFYFYIEQGELIIKKGWLHKERIAIPLERIQSTTISQNVIQRVLGIVSLIVDTAGSTKKELEIRGLEREVALQFKETINLKEEALKTVPTSEESLSPPINSHSDYRDQGRVFKLNIIDLLKAGITSNHLRSGGVALGFAVAILGKIREVLHEEVDDYVQDQFMNVLGSATLGFILVGVIVFLVISVIISLFTSIIFYYDFTLKLRNDHIEIDMGLIKRNSYKIPVSKVQSLTFTSNPLQRLLGFHTARIEQANSSGRKNVSTFLIPACKSSEVEWLQSFIYDDKLPIFKGQTHVHAISYARLAFMVAALLTCIPVLVVVVFNFYYPLILIPVVASLAAIIHYNIGKRSYISIHEEYIKLQKGWLVKKSTTLPAYKLQGVERYQSIFIKRRKQAHLKLHTAAGSKKLRYLSENALNQIVNHLNNQVWNSTKKWM